jgi:hypothetical protein
MRLGVNSHTGHSEPDPMPSGSSFLTLSLGDIEVGIGGSLMSPQWPKRSIFAPRGAFGRGGAMVTR